MPDSSVSLPTRPLSVRYFAILRDQRGVSHETIESSADTPAALYDQLARTYGLTLGRERLRVAVNDAFTDWDTALAANDTVVFIPPVAGG